MSDPLPTTSDGLVDVDKLVKQRDEYKDAWERSIAHRNRLMGELGSLKLRYRSTLTTLCEEHVNLVRKLRESRAPDGEI